MALLSDVWGDDFLVTPPEPTDRALEPPRAAVSARTAVVEYAAAETTAEATPYTLQELRDEMVQRTAMGFILLLVCTSLLLLKIDSLRRTLRQGMLLEATRPRT